MKPPLPLYTGFNEEQMEKFGPVRRAQAYTPQIRVYETPFVYDNLAIGDYYEINPRVGTEMKADTGYITIAEDHPIAAVTVVGSGCMSDGYNIVEWWDEGENIGNNERNTIKRQRVDNLKGTHPNFWLAILAKLDAAKGCTYTDMAPDDGIEGDYDVLRRLTQDFYEDLPLAFYENTTHFAVGKGPIESYPRKVTIRCGCKGVEDAGTWLEHRPADYSVRMIRTEVVT